MSQWDQQCELLAGLSDRVQELLLATIAANSKQGSPTPKFKPTARPRTMAHKARVQSQREKHEALVARVLPSKKKTE